MTVSQRPPPEDSPSKRLSGHYSNYFATSNIIWALGLIREYLAILTEMHT